MISEAVPMTNLLLSALVIVVGLAVIVVCLAALDINETRARRYWRRGGEFDQKQWRKWGSRPEDHDDHAD